MFAFLFHYILDDYVVWCGEVVWRGMLVSLAVMLVVDVVEWGCCSLFHELCGVCVCVCLGLRRMICLEVLSREGSD